MAGTFTHWMVVEDALDKYFKKSDKHPYFQYLMGNNHFVMLGAVSPDLPYLTELSSGFIKTHSWADRMHYENTGKIIHFGIKNIQKWPKESWPVIIAWLAGYASHLVTDAFIHPVVNAIVGPYHFNSTEHRHCEMTQDSMIFKEIKNLEIHYAEYADLLGNCNSGNNLNESLSKFWKECLVENYPGAKSYHDKILPGEWHKKYLNSINTASDPIAFFRHLGEKVNLVYKKTNDITPDEKTRFYTSVRMPGDRKGNFKTECFDKTVEKVIEVWDKLFMDINESKPENSSKYIKNWNLDTGVDEDQPDYWRGT